MLLNAWKTQKLRGLGYAGEDDADEVLRYRFGEVPSFDQVRSLSLEDREKWLDLECRRIVERCRRRPNERETASTVRSVAIRPM